MSTTIYQTEGFILKKQFTGETNVRLLVFTVDWGLIWIEAQGIRRVESKLRYHLDLYNQIDLSLIRGRSGFWRLIGVDTLGINNSLKKKKEYLPLLTNWSALFCRFLAIGQKQTALFEDLKEFLSLINQPQQLVLNEIKSLEIVFLIRFLSHLGYQPQLKPLNNVFLTSHWIERALSLPINQMPPLIKEINKAINLADL